MYLIKSEKNTASVDLAKSISVFLKNKKINHYIEKDSKKKIKNKDIKSIISVGGDKFILKTFRELGKLQIPVLCVSPTQSFLSQANPLNYKTFLGLLIKNNFSITKKERIACKINNTLSSIALNDIGLFSSKFQFCQNRL